MSNTRYPPSREVAESYELWSEYVDPDATMGEDEFDAMSVGDRLAIMRNCFRCLDLMAYEEALTIAKALESGAREEMTMPRYRVKVTQTELRTYDVNAPDELAARQLVEHSDTIEDSLVGKNWLPDWEATHIEEIVEPQVPVLTFRVFVRTKTSGGVWEGEYIPAANLDEAQVIASRSVQKGLKVEIQSSMRTPWGVVDWSSE